MSNLLVRNKSLTRKSGIIVLIMLLCGMLLQSCSTIRNETFYVSVVNDLKKEYVGKSKSYIIENFIYPITDIKKLDNQYEILICERYRPLGKGVTRFFILKSATKRHAD